MCVSFILKRSSLVICSSVTLHLPHSLRGNCLDSSTFFFPSFRQDVIEKARPGVMYYVRCNS